MGGVIRSHVRRTPLLHFSDPDTGVDMHLKLENLQWNGAFKVRPAAALMESVTTSELAAGVCTASSGNFGIAVAALAARRGIPATVVVPHTAPAAKLERLQRYGARVLKVSQEKWWETILTRHCDGVPGLYFDAVADTRAQAGGGTIGLEILEDLPDVDTVLVPFGGGGLVCGISAGMKAIRPRVRVIACESELATPLAAAMHAGRPVTVPCHPGFVSGIGAASVLPDMWPLLQQLIDDVVVMSLTDIAAAIRTLALHGHVVAEGAGAVSVAAARTGRCSPGRTVCVISGGNIGAGALATILAGQVPEA